jgi:hypothetical protein
LLRWCRPGPPAAARGCPRGQPTPTAPGWRSPSSTAVRRPAEKGRADGPFTRRMDGRTDGRAEGQTCREGESGRPPHATDGQTAGRTDRRTDGSSHGRTDWRTDGRGRRTGGTWGGGMGGRAAAQIGYTWSYMACRTGHLVSIRQPSIGTSFQSQCQGRADRRAGGLYSGGCKPNDTVAGWIRPGSCCSRRRTDGRETRADDRGTSVWADRRTIQLQKLAAPPRCKSMRFSIHRKQWDLRRPVDAGRSHTQSAHKPPQRRHRSPRPSRLRRSHSPRRRPPRTGCQWAQQAHG